MKLHFRKLLFLLSIVSKSPLFSVAQVATVCESLQPYEYDSGDTNTASTIVSYDKAPWIQLDLSKSELAAGASLRLVGKTTSQVLNAKDLSLNGYSAVFDGSSVNVELSSPGGVRGVTSRVVVSNVKVGLCVDYGIADSICGLEDDRIPSTDVRVGRIGGCTGWLISESVFVQAGHCGTPSSSARIHFVYGTGNAAPEDQYAVDVSTYKFENGGVGQDWGAARLLKNSVTGKLPGVAQSEKCGSAGCGWFNLGTVPSSGNIRITGYGTAAVDSRSQKTHFDALSSVASTYLRYVPDTTGGNSGSPVIHEETGDAVGVHTHGGCGETSGSNIGTRIDVPKFAAHIEFLTKDCTQNSDCDDGIFCNGVEVCNAGKCEFGSAVVCNDGLACTNDICNEAAGMCEYPVKTCSEPGATGQCSEPAGCEFTYGATLETWTGIGGATISNLMTATNNLNTPPNSSVRLGSLLESPTNQADNYGQRIKGWLVAPQTGLYTFWIASDDEGRLYLSTDDNPANKVQIANVPGWSNSREWTKFPSNQQSAQISLVAGRAYYMEALMKEGGGGDNLALAWAYGTQAQEVIPSHHMRMEQPQTASPTNAPTKTPTALPTLPPTTATPTNVPTNVPTPEPTTASPTNAPTNVPTAEPTTVSPTNAPTNAPMGPPTTATPTPLPTTAPPTNQPTSQPTSLCLDILDKVICQGTGGRCEWVNGKNSGCINAPSGPSPPSPSPPSPTPPSSSCTCSTITDSKSCSGCGNCSWSGKDKVCAAL